MVNGLDPAQFPPIAFIDLDGVVFEEGTDRFAPDAESRLRQLAQTHRIVFFSSRGPGSWIEVVKRTGIPVYGFISKPLACSYLYVDDRLDLPHCGVDLAAVKELVEVVSAPAWQQKEAEERELANLDLN